MKAIYSSNILKFVIFKSYSHKNLYIGISLHFHILFEWNLSWMPICVVWDLKIVVLTQILTPWPQNPHLDVHRYQCVLIYCLLKIYLNCVYMSSKIWNISFWHQFLIALTKKPYFHVIPVSKCVFKFCSYEIS